LDQNQDHQIDSDDIVAFMKQSYCRVSKREAELVIREYDADLDGRMTFEEFKQFCLPTTNRALRELCETRRNSHYYRNDKGLDQVSRELIAQ